MVKMYNQTPDALRWAIGSTTYTCAAWGSVEIDPRHVDPTKRRGVNVGVTEVAKVTRDKAAKGVAAKAGQRTELARLAGEVDRLQRDNTNLTERNSQLELSKIRADEQLTKLKTDLTLAEDKILELEEKLEALDKEADDLARALEKYETPGKQATG